MADKPVMPKKASELPPVMRMPTDPALKNMPYAEAVARINKTREKLAAVRKFEKAVMNDDVDLEDLEPVAPKVVATSTEKALETNVPKKRGRKPKVK